MPKSGWKKKLDASEGAGVQVVGLGSPNGYARYEDLVQAMVLAYAQKGTRLDPSFVKDIINSAKEVAEQLGWIGKPKDAPSKPVMSVEVATNQQEELA